jgi:hypothetical protein
MPDRVEQEVKSGTHKPWGQAGWSGNRGPEPERGELSDLVLKSDSR